MNPNSSENYSIKITGLNDKDELTTIKADFYSIARALKLDPALEHALKKLMYLEKGRGHKNQTIDLSEIRWSLDDWEFNYLSEEL